MVEFLIIVLLFSVGALFGFKIGYDFGYFDGTKGKDR